MKRTFTIMLLSIAVSLMTTGCMGLASVARQLKGDQAFVTAEVKTIYGSGFLVRDGRFANGNTVSADGNVSSIQPVVTNIVRNIQMTPEIAQQLLQAQASPPPAVTPVPKRAQRVNPGAATNHPAALPAK